MNARINFLNESTINGFFLYFFKSLMKEYSFYFTDI